MDAVLVSAKEPDLKHDDVSGIRGFTS